jgi:hypothetical protein
LRGNGRNLIEVISRKVSEGTENIRIYGVLADMRAQDFTHNNVTSGRHVRGNADAMWTITPYSLVGRYIRTIQRTTAFIYHED